MCAGKTHSRLILIYFQQPKKRLRKELREVRNREKFKWQQPIYEIRRSIRIYSQQPRIRLRKKLREVQNRDKFERQKADKNKSKDELVSKMRTETRNYYE